MGHFIKFKEIYRYKGFIIIKNTSHLPWAVLDEGVLGVIKSWREKEEQTKSYSPIPTHATLASLAGPYWQPFGYIGISPLCPLAYFYLPATVKPLSLTDE